MKLSWKNLIKLSKHDLSFVYLELFIRLFLGFLLFSTITVVVDEYIFSKYAFAILMSTLVLQIINGSTEILVNDNLSKNKNFLNLFFYKFILLNTLYLPILFNFKFESFLLIHYLVLLLSVSYEHIELRYRFFYKYYIFKYKIFFQLLLFPIKFFLAFNGFLFIFIFVNIIEVLTLLIFLFFGFKEVKALNDPFFSFILSEKYILIKFFSSSFLIFLFFKLDQIYIFFKAESNVFSSYFIAGRFNEILNGMVAIFTRYSVPKIISEDDYFVYRKYLHKNLSVHTLFSLIVLLPVFLYSYFIGGEYNDIVYFYLILALSGLFLVFGQIRGIYFLKRNFLHSDIINAIFGICVFALSVYFFENFIEISYVIPISYFLGFLFSGFITTFFYKIGWDFIFKMFTIQGEKNG